MSNILIDDLSSELEHADLAETRGGIWDYENRMGLVGAHLEERRNPTPVGGGGMSIEDAANAGDDSMYYPGLRPLRP